MAKKKLAQYREVLGKHCQQERVMSSDEETDLVELLQFHDQVNRMKNDIDINFIFYLFWNFS